MSYPQFEYEASRVAGDLNTGNAGDAAALLRNEIMVNPREASALIGRANQLSSPNRMDDILVDPAGNLGVRDRMSGQEIFAGRMPVIQPLPYPIARPIPYPSPVHRPYPMPRPRR